MLVLKILCIKKNKGMATTARHIPSIHLDYVCEHLNAEHYAHFKESFQDKLNYGPVENAGL